MKKYDSKEVNTKKARSGRHKTGQKEAMTSGSGPSVDIANGRMSARETNNGLPHRQWRLFILFVIHTIRRGKSEAVLCANGSVVDASNAPRYVRVYLHVRLWLCVSCVCVRPCVRACVHIYVHYP